MSDVICPIEGCPYGEDESKSWQSVRSHVNAKSDDAHDWDELQEAVMAQVETDDDGADDPTDAGDADDGDTDDEETDEEETEDMATDEELQRQQAQATTQDTPDDPAGQQSPADDDSGGFGLPALNGTTVMLLVGVLVVGALLYTATQSSGDGTAETPASEDSEGGGSTEETGETGPDVPDSGW